MIDAAHYASRVERLGRDVPAGLDALDMARLLDVYEDAKTKRGVIDFRTSSSTCVACCRNAPTSPHRAQSNTVASWS